MWRPALGRHSWTTTWAPGRGVAGEAAAKQRCLATLLLGVSCWLLAVTELSQTCHNTHREALAWTCFGVSWDWPSYPRCHLLLCI